MKPADDNKLRIWRVKRFDRLVKRTKLVPLRDIADWCAQRPNSVARDETIRLQALRDLESSVLSGEFGPPHKPCVFYLPQMPTAPPARLAIHLTDNQLVALRDWGANPINDLWAPRELCRKWLSARGIVLPPTLQPEEPADQIVAPTSPVSQVERKPKNRGGKPPKYDWDAFTREFVKRADLDGLTDRPRLTNHMRQWCIDSWGEEPSDSLLRDHIAKLWPQ